MTWLWVAWARDDESYVAERMLRGLLRRRYEPAAGQAGTVRICPRCASTSHGRPVLRNYDGPGRPSVSVARTPGVTVVALAGCTSVGVDVERTDRLVAAEVQAVLLHPAELATTPAEVAAAWVRKEALLKACGEGLLVDPASVRLDDSTGAPAVVDWPAPYPRPHWVSDVWLASNLTAAIAGDGAAPDEVTVYEAGRGGSLG